jgi:selenocysteine-specific elongation factor
VASAEVQARVRVLDGEEVTPAAAGLVQFRLEGPVVAGRGDRLVVRSYSPATTIAGALVLDPLPPKRRTTDRGALERLLATGGDLGAAAAWMVTESGARGVTTATLVARLSLPEGPIAEALVAQSGMVGLGEPPIAYLTKAALDELGQAALLDLSRFHREQPLRPAMPREELRRRAFSGSPEEAFGRVLLALEAAGQVRLLHDAVALSGHKVTLSVPENDARDRLLSLALQAGLAGLDPTAREVFADSGLVERVARVLADERLLLRVGGTLVHHEHLDALKQEVRARWPPGSHLDVGAFKELTGLTRKFVIPLLEFLDRERVTRRSGNDRLVLT